VCVCVCVCVCVWGPQHLPVHYQEALRPLYLFILRSLCLPSGVFSSIPGFYFSIFLSCVSPAKRDTHTHTHTHTLTHIHCTSKLVLGLEHHCISTKNSLSNLHLPLNQQASGYHSYTHIHTHLHLHLHFYIMHEHINTHTGRHTQPPMCHARTHTHTTIPLTSVLL